MITFECSNSLVMATIKYLLQSNSTNAPIYLRLSLNRTKSLKRKTGLSINSKEWSKVKGLPIQNNSTNKNLTTDLRKLSTSILVNLNKANSNGMEVTGDWLMYQIDLHFNRISENEQSDLLIDAIQNIIETASVRKNGKGGIGLSKSRINGYTNLKNIIENYQKRIKKRLLVKDINLKFVTDFSKYMQKENYADSYTQKKISDIKTVCIDAQINGIETSIQLPKVTGIKIKNKFIIYLNEKEIEDIENTEVNTKSLENAKKWLLLGCEVGQRGNDLLNLNESNIIIKDGKKRIVLIQQKTDKKVIIPFTQKMETLLKDSLPYKISIQKFNDYIKDVCKLAEINEVIEGSLKDKKTKRKIIGKFEKWRLLSSHDLRRTFASNRYLSNMQLPLIMSITGHATEKSFLIYVGKTSEDYAQQIEEFYDKEETLKERKPQLKIIKKAN